MLTHASPTRDFAAGLLDQIEKFRKAHPVKNRFDKGVDEVIEEGAAILNEARQQCQDALDDDCNEEALKKAVREENAIEAWDAETWRGLQ